MMQTSTLSSHLLLTPKGSILTVLDNYEKEIIFALFQLNQVYIWYFLRFLRQIKIKSIFAASMINLLCFSHLQLHIINESGTFMERHVSFCYSLEVTKLIPNSTYHNLPMYIMFYSF